MFLEKLAVIEQIETKVHDAGLLTGKNSLWFLAEKGGLQQRSQVGIDFVSSRETDKPNFGMFL